jgi:MFS superfamily sulfate permease-like transporter
MSLMPTAVLITGVAILESVGIAKALAAKNGYELDPNKEVSCKSLTNALNSCWGKLLPIYCHKNNLFIYSCYVV